MDGALLIIGHWPVCNSRDERFRGNGLEIVQNLRVRALVICFERIASMLGGDEIENVLLNARGEIYSRVGGGKTHVREFMGTAISWRNDFGPVDLHMQIMCDFTRVTKFIFKHGTNWRMCVLKRCGALH